MLKSFWPSRPSNCNPSSPSHGPPAGSHPSIATIAKPSPTPAIRTGLTSTILQQFGKVDCIAGVATGAIAQGALVADLLGVPFIYVRSAPKDHGMGNQIEGYFEKGWNVVVVEDLVSTGKSSLQAVDALRAADINVMGMVAIFTYLFPQSAEAFAKAGVELYTLSNYEELIATALENKYIQDSDVEVLKQWRHDPENWMK